MKCLYCDSETTRVIDCASDKDSVYRVRKCPVCGNKFSTIESIDKSNRARYTLNRIKSLKYNKTQ